MIYCKMQILKCGVGGGKKELKSATGIWTSDVPIVLPNSWPPFHLEQLGASCNLLIAQDICSLLSFAFPLFLMRSS